MIMEAAFDEPRVRRSPAEEAAEAASYASRRWDAENNLSQASLWASHPNAQHFVALNADYMMDRKNHGGINPYSKNIFKQSRFETNNHHWKPALVEALGHLVKAGTLTSENLTPELVAVISTFRNRYPSEEIPAEVQPIFDAVPQTSLKTKLIDRFLDPKKTARQI
jgi:hypothetical protein